VLSAFPETLSESARKQLGKLGVEVRTGTRVTSITQGHVETTSGPIPAANIIWAAGVSANPLTKKLGVELDRAGRVKVLPDLSLPHYPAAFAIGDGEEVIVPLTDQGPVIAGRPSLRHLADSRREDGTLLSASVPTVTSSIPIVGFDADIEHGADA
jgi:NADH dehydrogenase FAD-containing subunit